MFRRTFPPFATSVFAEVVGIVEGMSNEPCHEFDVVVPRNRRPGGIRVGFRKCLRRAGSGRLRRIPFEFVGDQAPFHVRRPIVKDRGDGMDGRDAFRNQIERSRISFAIFANLW